MRRILVLLHRWVGLCTAVFLFIAGSTGAMIAWEHELDAWLNPQLFHARSGVAKRLPSTTLAAQLEAREPRLRVRYMPEAVEPGHTLALFVEPRLDPVSHKPYELGYSQVMLDPATGEIQGRRQWGEAALSRESLLPFLYKLHYTLHLPENNGVGLGVLLMGIIAIAWTIDSFVSLWLSFPSRKTWRKSFAFRFGQGGDKLNFDLHRSGGVWVWGLLLTLAITAVSMNLGAQVVRPIVSLFSPLSPDPFSRPASTQVIDEPAVGRATIMELARVEGEKRGFAGAPRAVFYAAPWGFYGVDFSTPGKPHGSGLGDPRLYFDAQTGAVTATRIPGQGSGGDLFMQLQFPLHSGRLLGTTGRVVISVLGLIIAMLSITGIVIWAKKRRARVLQADKARRARASGEVLSESAPAE
jgi:uncharacterized iron-regulated membrane protein